MKFFIIFILIDCVYLLLLIQKKDVIENWNPNFLSVNTNTAFFNYFYDED